MKPPEHPVREVSLSAMRGASNIFWFTRFGESAHLAHALLHQEQVTTLAVQQVFKLLAHILD